MELGPRNPGPESSSEFRGGEREGSRHLSWPLHPKNQTAHRTARTTALITTQTKAT